MTDVEAREFVTFITHEYAENEWVEYKHNFHTKEEIAKENVEKSEIFDLLDTQLYFDLMQIPYPSDQTDVIERFERHQKVPFSCPRLNKFRTRTLGI